MTSPETIITADLISQIIPAQMLTKLSVRREQLLEGYKVHIQSHDQNVEKFMKTLSYSSYYPDSDDAAAQKRDAIRQVHQKYQSVTNHCQMLIEELESSSSVKDISGGCSEFDTLKEEVETLKKIEADLETKFKQLIEEFNITETEASGLIFKFDDFAINSDN